VGRYDAKAGTVTLTVTHLSWYGDMLDVGYQLIRKTLGEWLGKFRASKPTCTGGPQIRYPLQTMFEPPVLACVSGDQNGGVLKVANNRGFYLMVNPQRGLTIRNLEVDGALDAATGGGGALIRHLGKWHSLPLPPTATAEFTYQPVAGGPALSFEPDQAATFVAVVLQLFAGISDRGSLLLHVFECVNAVRRQPQKEWMGCVINGLAVAADQGWTADRETVRFAGLTVSRKMLGLLSVVLQAIPALDMAIESRDGGSASTIQLELAPRGAGGAAPSQPASRPPGGGGPAPTNPPPPGPANRFAIASYDRLTPGARYAEWYQAWQDFTAKSNTITRLAINVGDARWAPGPIPVSTTLRLCRDSGCTQQIGAWSTQIHNYGTTAVDIGDVAVQPGATYHLRFDRPDSAHSWRVYFWGPATYQELSASVHGYNR
jgi:hypothetical protein